MEIHDALFANENRPLMDAIHDCNVSYVITETGDLPLEINANGNWRTNTEREREQLWRVRA